MAALGSGSGKLILFGEHSAVFGHGAIGAQLPERTLVTLDGDGAVSWNLRRIDPSDRPVVQRLLDMLETLLPDLRLAGRTAVSIESSVPRGVGLGSSAALCSALAGAALDLISRRAGPGPDIVRLWSLAHELERAFHGTPSGIDTGLSLLPGLTAFSPRPPALPQWERLSPAPVWLVVAALPRAGDTGGLVRDIGDRMRAGKAEVREAISRLGAIAAQAKQELAASAGAPGGHLLAASLGELAGEAMRVLRGLALSSPALDLLLEEGMDSGALGGKLSGAGGGGAFFLVSSAEEAARGIVSRITQAARARGIAFVADPRVLRVGAQVLRPGALGP